MTGWAAPPSFLRRAEVVRHPRTLDYFRRTLSRFGPAAAQGGDDPAARLLDMTRDLLRPAGTAAASAPRRVNGPGEG